MILAHAGHILIDLPIFAGPVLAVVAFIVIQSRMDNRRDERDEADERVSRPPAG